MNNFETLVNGPIKNKKRLQVFKDFTDKQIDNNNFPEKKNCIWHILWNIMFWGILSIFYLIIFDYIYLYILHVVCFNSVRST